MGHGAGNEHDARGEQAGRGYGLLVAATPPGRHPAVDATEALPALAATSPSVLLGTGTGTVVQLADPGDPNTVLSHLRTAAAHDGPLLVYLAGQLMLDPREQLPHLALTRSTPRSVRYTGLPWHWLAAEFGRRPPGLTAVVADLVADDAMWQRRSQHGLAGGLLLYGTLAAPPARRGTRAPEYSRALAGVLRASRVRPSLDELHQLALHGAGFGYGGEERVLLGTAPAATARPGARQMHGQVSGHLPGQVPVPGHAPVPGYAPVTGPAAAAEQAPPPVPAPGPAPAPTPAEPPSTPPPPPRSTARAPQEPAPPPQPPVPPQPQPQPATDTECRGPGDVPAGVHDAIYRAAGEGRHGEAATMAAQWETAALRASGPHSKEAVHWVEVRADLAHRAGDAARACTLWLQAAAVRLQSGQAPDAPEVFGAVDRAHHCWHQVTDRARAYPLGVQLAELRERAPGHRPGAVRDVQDRLASLTADPGPGEQAADG